MKKLLATTAIATMAFTGGASAQSVLERVLQQTSSLNEVTGIFANTADNIGVGNPTLQFVDSDGAILSQTQFDTVLQDAIDAEIASITFTDEGGAGEDEDKWVFGGVEYDTLEEARDAAVAAATADTRAAYSTQLLGGTGSIDGSIDIVARRIQSATASVDNEITAIEGVTTNFGNMATTVLGAVNTGEIGLGTNQVVEEALAGTSTAIRSTIAQIGTIEGRTQLAVNSALNTMDIDGSINVELDGVNASVAAISPDQLNILSDQGALTLAGLDGLLGSMETTVLGAVNTGTIVSGVNNQVDGTVAGIVGNSATNMFAAAPTAPAETAPAE